MPKTCEQCLKKQSKLFSIHYALNKRCAKCKKDDSTRDFETICDECSEIYEVCRDCGDEV